MSDAAVDEVYERELGAALGSPEIRPWIVEGLIEEEWLRGVVTAEEAVRDAHAAVGRERARLERLSEQVDELGVEVRWMYWNGTTLFLLVVTVVLLAGAVVCRLAGVEIGFWLLMWAGWAFGSPLLMIWTDSPYTPGPQYGGTPESNRRAEEIMLARQARKERLRELRRERAEAEAAWREALRERGILPRLRLAVNEALDGGNATELVVRDRKGLGGVPDPARMIDPSAAPRIQRLLTEMPGATVAVAGPHGVGKSTLLRAVCEGRYISPGGRPDLSVVVAAPVGYVPREFVLTLFAAVCRAVLADAGRDTTLPLVPPPGRWRSRWAVRRALPWLLTAAGAGLLLWPRVGELDGVLREHPGMIGGVLLAAGGAPLTWRAVRRRNPPRPSMADMAQEHLGRLQTVRSIAYGSGGTAALLGSNAQVTRMLTLTTQAPTHPELVEEFRGFLTVLARELRADGRRLILAVDELDRIGGKAAEFLDELKAVFRVPGCFFLLSVADDVAIGFTGRHTPATDSLESAFDDLVRLDFLDWTQSRDLLQRRVVGMPGPFTWLCHVLSGGVARELLRTARRLLWTHDELGVSDLPTLARLVTDAALAERVGAVRATLLLRPPGDAAACDRDRLRLELDEAERDLGRPDAGAWEEVRVRLAAPRPREGVDAELWTLRETLATHAYFQLTVVELATEWCAGGRWADPPEPGLASLARSCTGEPALARRRLDEIRHRHGLAGVA